MVMPLLAAMLAKLRHSVKQHFQACRRAFVSCLPIAIHLNSAMLVSSMVMHFTLTQIHPLNLQSVTGHAVLSQMEVRRYKYPYDVEECISHKTRR